MAMTGRTSIGPDAQRRCAWCAVTPEYIAYHDTEWGFPVADDRRLFEKLSLEGFQAGLSWRTILAKRERFRTVFHQFEIERVARFGARDIERLLHDPGIVRHRGKIEAVIHNARCARELIGREGSLAAFIWRYGADRTRRGPSTAATSEQSVALSKDLKRLGWRFVGPTTVYAFMQAVGLVNDHATGCVIRGEAERARAQFELPVPPRRPARRDA
jgi:DNA-3-methyladenine glycosylase I